MNDGIKTRNQMQGTNERGEAKNIRVDDNGALKVSIENGQTAGNTSKKVEVLYSGFDTLSGETELMATQGLNITEIEIANYDENNPIILNHEITIAPNVAVTIPAHNISTPITLGIGGSGSPVKYYILIKGIKEEEA